MKATKATKATKAGLADLKRLRAEAAASPATVIAPARRPAGRKAARGANTQGAADQASHPAPASPLDPADRALFRQAMRFVQPLRRSTARAAGPSRLAPEEWLQARRAHAAGQQAPDDQAAPPVALTTTRQRQAAHFDPDDRQYLHPDCGPDVLRRLRRGKWPIEATLDLHGSTLEHMDERLARFLASCLAHHIRCVRIVHGKGHGSRTGVAILKDAVRRRLSQLDAVQAWIECNEAEGGAGAVMALLRQPTTKDMP